MIGEKQRQFCSFGCFLSRKSDLMNKSFTTVTGVARPQSWRFRHIQYWMVVMAHKQDRHQQEYPRNPRLTALPMQCHHDAAFTNGGWV
jgi:hypothetical protein